MDIKNNILNFQRKLPETVTLIAVSKTKSPELIKEAYNAGHRNFGENKAQELTAKATQLPDDIHWHMIGHLQRNKVRQIIDFVHMIHSVDSEKLLKEINKRAKNANRVVDCLLQVHIADEEAKFGWDSNELLEFLNNKNIVAFSNIRIKGLMGMATLTDEKDKIKAEFHFLSQLKEKIAAMVTSENVEMNELSTGMSADYEIALEEGSTMVRVGTTIFGEREDIWKP